MKNLKINNEKFKRLMSFGLACVLAGSFTGCASKNVDKNEDNELKLETVVADNKMISVADLKLKDTKTNKVLDNETIDAILVDNKLDREFDLIEVVFNSSVDSILVGDELLSVDRLVLINGNNNEEIDALDYALVGDELVPMNKYIKGMKNVDTASTNETVSDDEYEELTDKKFYALADEVYKKYEKIGLDVSKEEVIDFVMMVNIDRLAKDNNDLIETIIGDRNTDLVVLNMMDVYSAIKTKNDNNYCAKGLGFDSLILVSDTVFDKDTKEKVVKFEERVKEVFDARNNKEQFNTLLNTLLMEVLTATEEEFNMENGAGYSCMEVLIYFIRSNFTNSLNKANGELIKYFCNYATEFGTDYYYNSRSTAYYSSIYYLLTENLGCVKAKTK